MVQGNPGCPKYEYKGTDSDGLDLWYCNRGTVRAENHHQKLENLIGPFGVGVQTGHYLLVLQAFCYNVSTGVARCGEPSFGHP
jgi:hypothetical protein